MYVMAAELEERLNLACESLGISEANRESLQHKLFEVRQRDEATYTHSLRVGLLAKDIAAHYGLDIKAHFWGGLLHDYGKTAIDGKLLTKKEPFTEEDYKKIRVHPERGYELLEGKHAFAALVALFHHCYQGDRSYPFTADGVEKVGHEAKTGDVVCSQRPAEEIDALLQRIKVPEVVIAKARKVARLVSIADFYDAITTRDNTKFGGKVGDPARIKEAFQSHKPDDYKLVAELIDKGVLSTKYTD